MLKKLEAREVAARMRVEKLEVEIAELTVRLEAEREAWTRLRVRLFALGREGQQGQTVR
ncbi:hypothetical protein [Streptomyces sp. AP-93]|uniref:hypothetical protein n=1 Tax=Streptomyces sp. AP-93 TaxID=2929048 RepID=UPI001FAFFA28|nr:hypothetical protein [Streptomyces sp. AP-93]MCJ0875599.1 hypothetical protein [Streptomyces sp. AP-93]